MASDPVAQESTTSRPIVDSLRSVAGGSVTHVQMRPAESVTVRLAMAVPPVLRMLASCVSMEASLAWQQPLEFIAETRSLRCKGSSRSERKRERTTLPLGFHRYAFRFHRRAVRRSSETNDDAPTPSDH